jgi:hypothetical protein
MTVLLQKCPHVTHYASMCQLAPNQQPDDQFNLFQAKTVIDGANYGQEGN